MEIIETTIDGAIVRLRLADSADPAAAIESIDIVVKTNPDSTHPLTAIQGDALQRARNAIDAEMKRLQSLASQNP